MKLGIVLYSNDPEIVYQAFRLCIFSLKKGDQVDVFLLAKGVECENIDTERYNVSDQIDEFLSLGGKLYSCTTCIKARGKEKMEVCPLSTMGDLYCIISESDRVLTF